MADKAEFKPILPIEVIVDADELAALREQLVVAEAQLAAAMGLIISVESIADEVGEWCPWCGGGHGGFSFPDKPIPMKHKRDCPRQAFLADPANAEVVERAQKAERVLRQVEELTGPYSSIGNPGRIEWLREVLLADEPKEG